MKTNLEALPAELPAPGIERRRITGERLELIYYRYAPGSTFPLHSHDSEQLTIVLSGEIVFTLEEGEVRLVAGEALLLESNRSHGAYVPGGSEPALTYNVFTPVRSRPPG